MSWIPNKDKEPEPHRNPEMDGKEIENWNEQKSMNRFNSVTHSAKPENQNQFHNVREEGIKPKNQDR
jgi:hypothetical protein